MKVKDFPNNTFFDSEPGGREAAPGLLALVQAFVNTREAERDWEALSDPESLRSWLRARGLLTNGGTIEDHDVARARDVREALRALLAANNRTAEVGGEAIRTLNRAAGRAGLTVRFGKDGRAALSTATGGVDGALGEVLAAVYGAMQGGTWERLKTCANESCTWAFYDRSKNRSGQWCSMGVCGNRAKTRAYRRRRAEAG